MPLSHAKIDLSLLPEDTRIICKHLAEKHNALVLETSEVYLELEQITGSTPEEKAEMHQAFSLLKRGVHFLHKKRFNVMLISFQLYLLLSVFRLLGVSPEALNSLIQTFCQLITKTLGD